jgi:hypothetical protein
MSRIEKNAPQTPKELAVMRGIMKARLEPSYAEAAGVPLHKM